MNLSNVELIIILNLAYIDATLAYLLLRKKKGAARVLEIKRLCEERE